MDEERRKVEAVRKCSSEEGRAGRERETVLGKEREGGEEEEALSPPPSLQPSSVRTSPSLLPPTNQGAWRRT
jgi:hypothetical protein